MPVRSAADTDPCLSPISWKLLQDVLTIPSTDSLSSDRATLDVAFNLAMEESQAVWKCVIIAEKGRVFSACARLPAGALVRTPISAGRGPRKDWCLFVAETTLQVEIKLFPTYLADRINIAPALRTGHDVGFET